MTKYAAIDVGSNSILLYIAEKDEQGRWTTLVDTGEITRLGEGLQVTDSLRPEAMERTIHAITDFMGLIRKHNVEHVAAVGTMCLREAKNSAEFLHKVKDECNLAIEVISGEEEARLSCLAVKSGLKKLEGRFVIFDVGGGSTEFTFGNGGNVEHKLSINIGAIALTEKYLISNPVTKGELDTLLEAVEKAFTDFKAEREVHALIGMGGTMTNIGAVMHKLAVYNSDVIHGSVAPFSEIERQMELYRSKTLDERKAIVGLQPKRADVILAGVGIAYIIMKKFGVESVTISDRSIRHGLLFDRFHGHGSKNSS